MKKFLMRLLFRDDSGDYLWRVFTKAKSAKNPISRYYNRYLHKKLMTKYNASIPYIVDIAGRPAYPHGIAGIFISANATIGKGCTIFHQVTIGSNTLGSSKGNGAPKIGDNVFIGCGAKIIGGVTIGNNVRIGANCVVVEDIPDNSTVVLGKPRIITHDSARDNTFVAITDFN